MSALWPVLMLVAAVFPLGWVAARANHDRRFAMRLAAGVAMIIAITLIVSIARGELLRFAPDAAENDTDSLPSIR